MVLKPAAVETRHMFLHASTCFLQAAYAVGQAYPEAVELIKNTDQSFMAQIDRAQSRQHAEEPSNANSAQTHWTTEEKKIQA